MGREFRFVMPFQRKWSSDVSRSNSTAAIVGHIARPIGKGTQGEQYRYKDKTDTRGSVSHINTLFNCHLEGSLSEELHADEKKFELFRRKQWAASCNGSKL